MTEILESRNHEFSILAFYRLGLSALISILLFPLLGMYFALLVGYVFFSSLIREWNGKLAILTGFVLFLAASIVLIRDSTYLAEELGSIAYFFFLTGTVQEVIIIIRMNMNSSLTLVKQGGQQWGMENL